MQHSVNRCWLSGDDQSRCAARTTCPLAAALPAGAGPVLQVTSPLQHTSSYSSDATPPRGTPRSINRSTAHRLDLLVPCARKKDCWLHPSTSGSVATLHRLHLPRHERPAQRALPATLHNSLKAGRSCAWWCAHCILHFSAEANLVIKTLSPPRKEAGGWEEQAGVPMAGLVIMPTWLSESECTVHESVCSCSVTKTSACDATIIDISLFLQALFNNCGSTCTTLSCASRSVQCPFALSHFDRCPSPRICKVLPQTCICLSRHLPFEAARSSTRGHTSPTRGCMVHRVISYMAQPACGIAGIDISSSVNRAFRAPP